MSYRLLGTALKQTLTIGGDDRVATIGSELSGGLGGGWWMAVTLTMVRPVAVKVSLRRFSEWRDLSFSERRDLSE